MNKDDTKQAIIGFMEFTKGITGNKDLKIPEDIAKEYGIDQDDTLDNLCNSCTNIGCEFQSGIVRTKCAFYMPPHIESDNCGNYVVMQPTVEAIPKAEYEARLKADMVTILDKIREEIKDTLYVDSLIFGELIDFKNGKISADDVIEEFNRVTRMEVLQIIDKYKGESEDKE